MSQIIYVSKAFPEDKFKTLVTKYSIAGWKFNQTILEGLADNDASIESFYVVDEILGNSKIVRDKITYHSMEPKSGLKRIKAFNELLQNVDLTKTTYLFCDYLNLKDTYFALRFAKKNNLKSIALVTDLPDELYMEVKMKNKAFAYMYKSISYFILGKFQYFVLINERMSERIRKSNGENSVILEGVINNRHLTMNESTFKAKKKEIIYAGSLHEEYGIKNLIEAFQQIEKKDYILRIFGDGNYKSQILEMTKNTRSIIYEGVVENDHVVEVEEGASLLVNPRPCGLSFSKYSFPSKLIEYMATGTPCLTTHLSSIPAEYNPYLFFCDESVVGIANAMNHILNLNESEIQEKGLKAKQFIFTKKNSVVQTKKILDLINKGVQ